MKVVLAALAIAAAAALGVLALDPHMDAACALARIKAHSQHNDKGWQCLHYAAARGDASAVAAALDNGAPVDPRTDGGQTPLLLAARSGQLKIVRRLIERRASIGANDARAGFTALHWAAQRYYPAVARALVRAGAPVDAEDNRRRTPLWHAARQANQANTEIAHILISAGADVTRADRDGNTPLMMAARTGHRPMVAYLLASGARIEARNNYGQTPLYRAVDGGHPRVVRLLLARGADPDAAAAGVAPLQLALNRGEQDMAALLRANGARGYERYAVAAAIERGKAAQVAGDYAKAIRIFGRAVSLRPDSARAYYHRGLAFSASGARREAESDLRRALKLDAGKDDAREALARLYVENGDYRRALAPLNRLLSDQPKNARALYLLGESRHALGEAATAGDYFSRACELDFQPACSR